MELELVGNKAVVAVAGSKAAVADCLVAVVDPDNNCYRYYPFFILPIIKRLWCCITGRIYPPY